MMGSLIIQILPNKFNDFMNERLLLNTGYDQLLKRQRIPGMARTRELIWCVGATLNSFTVKKLDYLLRLKRLCHVVMVVGEHVFLREQGDLETRWACRGRGRAQAPASLGAEARVLILKLANIVYDVLDHDLNQYVF